MVWTTRHCWRGSQRGVPNSTESRVHTELSLWTGNTWQPCSITESAHFIVTPNNQDASEWGGRPAGLQETKMAAPGHAYFKREEAVRLSLPTCQRTQRLHLQTTTRGPEEGRHEDPTTSHDSFQKQRAAVSESAS